MNRLFLSRDVGMIEQIITCRFSFLLPLVTYQVAVPLIKQLRLEEYYNLEGISQLLSHYM